jgi:hypothetical protein
MSSRDVEGDLPTRSTKIRSLPQGDLGSYKEEVDPMSSQIVQPRAWTVQSEAWMEPLLLPGRGPSGLEPHTVRAATEGTAKRYTPIVW